MLSLCRYKLQGLLQVNLQYEASSMPKRYQNAGSLLNRKATLYGLKSHTCSREAIILNSHLFNLACGVLTVKFEPIHIELTNLKNE